MKGHSHNRGKQQFSMQTGISPLAKQNELALMQEIKKMASSYQVIIQSLKGENVLLTQKIDSHTKNWYQENPICKPDKTTIDHQKDQATNAEDKTAKVGTLEPLVSFSFMR